MKFISYSTILLIVIFLLARPTYTAEMCDPLTMPYDPDNTYCQSCDFVCVGGRSVFVFVKCSDYGEPCCTFALEKYIGTLSCCTNSDCRDCLPFMYQGQHGHLWSVLRSSPDMWYCGDENVSQVWPEHVRFYDNYNCDGEPSSIVEIDEPPSFCGNCDEGDGDKDVCIEFNALFNPCLDPDCTGLCCAPFDCLPSQCWDICGDNMEALIWCQKLVTCGDPDCVAW